MTTILHIDSSARTGLSGIQPYGSHTRRLTAHFIDRWRAREPEADILHRDVAVAPPRPVDDRWVEAAFTPPAKRTGAMKEVLRESDQLVDELERSDIVLIGAPMYNFGLPATLKAWIDNVVRVGSTFGFDRQRSGAPYWPMIEPGKRLIVLSARGDGGYDPGQALASSNLVEAGVRVPMAYIGITDFTSIAVEWDEFADSRILNSIQAAECAIERKVVDMQVSEPVRRRSREDVPG